MSRRSRPAPPPPPAPVAPPTADDLWLFHEGKHERLWEVLGAHPSPGGGPTRFAVWAPAARSISVVGEWNGWTGGVDRLERLEGSGVWTGGADAPDGALYKYEIEGADGAVTQRADPMAQSTEGPDGTASRVFHSTHEWRDDAWMRSRGDLDPVAGRISTYEVHLGSWRRHPDGRPHSYRELAPALADHVLGLGFTHVELLPPAEHPYDPSWGYQVTSYFAPTARFGGPDDFRWFVDHLHQRGLGVIVDWVPAHFPRDAWALARFDGGPLYEHTDPLRAEHPDWGTLEFDFGRPEVKGFLIANALYWLGELHVDGLRVDAVASMLYLDYSRQPGQWRPNVFGGNQDLESVAFLQELNTVVHRVHPGVLTIAEESTAWDGVSRPVHLGGLGFTHKWNMGWMHDTLSYFSEDPIHRRWHHDQITFGLAYAFAENFVLPLSHDEVVHLKKPLVGKMGSQHGTDRFDDLRSLYAWMWAHPGKQLLFMGAELAEQREWSHDRELDWGLLQDPAHSGVAALVAALNEVQAAHPALYAGDGTYEGFDWLVVDDRDHSTFAIERSVPGAADQIVVCVANLSGSWLHGYRVGLRSESPWHVLLSTAETRFGGHGHGPAGEVVVDDIPWQHRPASTVLDVPPRTVLYLAPGSAEAPA
ncbi:MAG TPA: 1,4-alpha-glucan branching protein GlgB [Acidimicrobiales bacterium]|nr:1,4-alpha-glucan branching protein GlgB [Acidimicrobiales bacterium]